MNCFVRRLWGPRRAGLPLMAVLLVAVLIFCGAVSAVLAGEEHDDSDFSHTNFLTAIGIPGNAIRSFDISWVDSERGLYFLGDRSNSGVDIISTETNTFLGRAGGFVGIVLNATPTPTCAVVGTCVDNNHSGPDGVVSRGNCLYAGDGNSTLRVYNISDPTHPTGAHP